MSHHNRAATLTLAGAAAIGLVFVAGGGVAQAPVPIPSVWLQNATPGTTQTGHASISGTVKARDLRLDDGLIGVNAAGSSIFQLLVTGPGVAEIYGNPGAGNNAAALGTSTDGSGFIELYNKLTGSAMALLEADVDGGSNGIASGVLSLRSQGAGGLGGRIGVQNNDGFSTFEVVGGGTGGIGTVSMFNLSGATTLRMLGEVGGRGGELRTNDEAGNYQSIVQPDIHGSGVFVFWSRDTAADGLAFDGNNSGSGNPRLDLFGTNGMAFNTNSAGNSSVALPADAIASPEVFDEPGVANIHANTVALGASIAAITSRTITVPAAGHILVMAQGDLQILHTTGTGSNVTYGVSAAATTLPVDQDVQTQLVAAMPSGTYDFSASAHGLFEVASAGAYTFFFNGNRGASGTANMFDIQLTLLYLPTAYGPVLGNRPTGGGGEEGSESADRNDSRSVGSPLTNDDILNEQANAGAFHQLRLESELSQMRAQMESMQARLAQLQREQGLVRRTQGNVIGRHRNVANLKGH